MKTITLAIAMLLARSAASAQYTVSKTVGSKTFTYPVGVDHLISPSAGLPVDLPPVNSTRSSLNPDAAPDQLPRTNSLRRPSLYTPR
jgi:hypothetical protein